MYVDHFFDLDAGDALLGPVVVFAAAVGVVEGAGVAVPPNATGRSYVDTPVTVL